MNPNANMSKMHSSQPVSHRGQNADGYSHGPHDGYQGHRGEWMYNVPGL